MFSERFKIGMPEMTMEGLSENWLFKKLGAVHWELITQTFNTPSSKLVDINGNRLYASFVRITLEGNQSIENIKENDVCNIDSSLKRFGSDMFFSEANLKSEKTSYKGNLITMFSSREQENENTLKKSSIYTNKECIESVKIIPEHAQEYRRLKRGDINQITLNKYTFELSGKVLYSNIYTINPYYDVNGLNLLYFASYPTISDFNESLYFTQILEFKNWSNEFYTQARDIFYYANCNPTDKIIYQLHYYEFLNEKLVKIHSSLIREKDNLLMAKIFTLKSKL